MLIDDTTTMPEQHTLTPTGVTLRWDNVQLEVDIPATDENGTMKKRILKGITGTASPGELLVIMGPLGAGKSILLDCLANHNTNYSGNVTINGQSWTDEMSKLSAYVLQDDLFYTTLTVKEHLQFQAELHMGKGCTSKERETRMVKVIANLGLVKCQDTMIGMEMPEEFLVENVNA